MEQPVNKYPQKLLRQVNELPPKLPHLVNRLHANQVNHARVTRQEVAYRGPQERPVRVRGHRFPFAGNTIRLEVHDLLLIQKMFEAKV